MPEPKMIGEWKTCKQCGSEETVAHLGTAELREKGKIAEDAPCRLEQTITPLEQLNKAVVVATVIVTDYDVCAGCGLKRAVRAQLVTAPIQMPMGGQGRSFPPGGGRG